MPFGLDLLGAVLVLVTGADSAVFLAVLVVGFTAVGFTAVLEMVFCGDVILAVATVDFGFTTTAFFTTATF